MSRRSVLAVSSVAAVLAGGGVWYAYGVHAARNPSVRPLTSDPSPTAASGQTANGTDINATLDALQTADDALPKQEFDVSALADSIGSDPEKAFDWVRDQTTWVPYRGVLRGPTGVLFDRCGNSLDRALLLATLIKDGGGTVRLAHATLSPDVAQGIWTSLSASPRVLPHAAPVPSAARAPTTPQSADDVATRQTIAQMKREIPAQAGLIVDTLKPAGVAADSTSADTAAGIAALRDHYWVEYQDGETWTALDPLLPDAAAKHSIATADDTIDPDSLDAGLSQRIGVHVVVERWTAGALHERELVNATIAAADAATTPISVSHVAPDLAKVRRPTRPEDLIAQRAAIAGEQRWIPTLRIGDKVTMGRGFDGHGDPIHRASSDGGPLGGGFMGALGGGPPRGESAVEVEGTPTPDGVVTAEWLDFDIDVPGQPPRRVRREIFDVIGPAARSSGQTARPAVSADRHLDAALTLLGNIDVLVQNADEPAVSVFHRMAQARLSARDALTQFASESDPEARQKLLPDVLGADVTPSLTGYALARQFLGPAARTFIASPNIVTDRARYVLGAGSRVAVEELVDVAANDRGVRPGIADAFSVRLTQGVTDTAAELLARGGNVADPANTFSLIAAARARHAAMAAITRSRADAVTTLGISADPSARITVELGEHFAIVAPVSGSGHPVGWWRVDPATGATVGVMASGFNQMTEQVELRDAIAEQYLKDLNPRWTKEVFCATPLNHMGWQMVGLEYDALAHAVGAALFNMKNLLCDGMVY